MGEYDVLNTEIKNIKEDLKEHKINNEKEIENIKEDLKEHKKTMIKTCDTIIESFSKGDEILKEDIKSIKDVIAEGNKQITGFLKWAVAGLLAVSGGLIVYIFVNSLKP